MSELNKDELFANSLSEHIDNNAEAQKRFMLIIADATPHISHLIIDLMDEWHRINKEINDELKAELNKL